MNYKWQIDAVERFTDNNIIKTLHWRYALIEDELMIDTFGAIELPEPTDEVIPYEDLTTEQLVGWLESMLDVEIMQATLTERLELLKKPITIIEAWHTNLK